MLKLNVLQFKEVNLTNVLRDLISKLYYRNYGTWIQFLSLLVGNLLVQTLNDIKGGVYLGES
jgi:hypothetical protein